LGKIEAIRRGVQGLLAEAQQLERCDKVLQVIMDANKMLFFL
jgi:hypothetical protein